MARQSSRNSMSADRQPWTIPGCFSARSISLQNANSLHAGCYKCQAPVHYAEKTSTPLLFHHTTPLRMLYSTWRTTAPLNSPTNQQHPLPLYTLLRPPLAPRADLRGTLPLCGIGRGIKLDWAEGDGGRAPREPWGPWGVGRLYRPEQDLGRERALWGTRPNSYKASICRGLVLRLGIWPAQEICVAGAGMGVWSLVQG